MTTHLAMRDQDLAWQRFSQVHAVVTAGLDRALFRAHRLRLSDYYALRNLADAVDGSLRMQDLADAVGLNQSSVTRLVARLEQRGLCERCLCPDDRRGVFTRIHDAGRALVAEATKTYHEVIQREFERHGLAVTHTDTGYQVTLANGYPGQP